MASRRREPSVFRDLVLVLLALVLGWVGPRLIRASSALAWARYHAEQAPDPAGQHAKEEARWAEKVLRLSAPLPWGATACRLALDFGARQEATNPAAALALYNRMRTALESVSQSRWRGWGLSELLEEARRREDAQRARVVAPAKPS
jgi:hypothetical protein